MTKPTRAMREAMMAAEVGDDMFGDDPTVCALEEKVAGLLGKEAAIFVPSGTMANQIAINLHAKPSEMVICEEGSHAFWYESGAAAALSGVQFNFLRVDQWGDEHVLRALVRGRDIHDPTTTLLIVENTQNRGGGRAFAPELLDRIVQQGKNCGLALHCDGARLWNAAIAVGKSEKDLVVGFDSVSVCFSKGLGAPVGSALAGSREFVDRARRIRKRFGGAMRQCGILAAGAIYAIDHHRERLAQDHERCRVLQEALMEKENVVCKYPDIPTNMLYFQIKGRNGDQVVEECAAKGLRFFHLGNDWLRVVFHLDIDDKQFSYAKQILMDL